MSRSEKCGHSNGQQHANSAQHNTCPASAENTRNTHSLSISLFVVRCGTRKCLSVWCVAYGEPAHRGWLLPPSLSKGTQKSDISKARGSHSGTLLCKYRKKVVHEVVIQKKISTFAGLLPCNDAACRREGWGQLIFY